MPDQAPPEGLPFWVPSSQENVFQNGQAWPLSRRLEGADQPEAGDTVRRQALDRDAFGEDGTCVGKLEPRYEIDRCALAGAVGADQPGHLALRSSERTAINGGHPPKPLGKPFNHQNPLPWLRYYRSSLRRRPMYPSFLTPPR